MDPTLVALGYHETDRAQALDSAIAESNLFAAVQPGDSVYLRVNSNSGDKYPYSTSPDLIVAVGRRLHDLGVTDIRIGDRSFWGDPDTQANLERNGIAAAAEALGTKALVFDDSVAWVSLPPDALPHWQPPIRIPELVQSATHFINLACVKTHFIAHITMCLKLCLGLVHSADRRREGNLDTHVSARLWSQIAEVSARIRPTINILDGYEAVVTGGPTVNDVPPGAPENWKAETARPRTIIASADPIAADVVGAALLRRFSRPFEMVRKKAPFDLPQIKACMAFGGIGLAEPSQLRLVGTTVPDLDAIRTELGV
jgi:uncharacterized protein (DUF362 family)